MPDQMQRLLGGLYLLPGDENERGISLERACREILERFGYNDVRQRVRKTGAEIDLWASQSFDKGSVHLECKATVQLVGPRQLRLAFSELKKAQAKEPSTTLIFISLSGYTGTALAWADELEPLDKSRVILYGPKQLEQFITSSGLGYTRSAASARTSEILGCRPKETFFLFTPNEVI